MVESVNTERYPDKEKNGLLAYEPTNNNYLCTYGNK